MTFAPDRLLSEVKPSSHFFFFLVESGPTQNSGIQSLNFLPLMRDISAALTASSINLIGLAMQSIQFTPSDCWEHRTGRH